LKKFTANTSPTESKQRLSQSYLSQQLDDGKFLVNNFRDENGLVIIEEPTLNETINNASATNNSPEKIVIVGQALNIETLNKIVNQYFSNAQLVVIKPHFLNGQFAQQALVVMIYKTSSGASTEPNTNQTTIISNDELRGLSQNYFIDAFRVTDASLSTPGLLVMDMDSTIINMECIDEIASLVGVGEKVSAITEQAMLGELDFNQSLNARVSCLKGVTQSELEKLKSRLPINPGFANTIKVLQANGWITCIASGGFTYFANYLKDTFDLTCAISNTLALKDGILTGKVEGEIINGEMKKQVLLQKMREHNVEPSQTMAIGDGANDLLMMEAAAVGVAYKAKPKVQIAANANIYYCGFEGLLYCLKR
jgi:phosphoserine phosphatase